MGDAAKQISTGTDGRKKGKRSMDQHRTPVMRKIGAKMVCTYLSACQCQPEITNEWIETTCLTDAVPEGGEEDPIL